MSFDDFKTLCEQRRSIRYFDDKPVSTEDIMKLLQLAQLAPSVENLQPWHFHIIENKDLRHKLIETSCYGNFIEGASIFIVVTANTSIQNKAKEPLWNAKELEYSCIAAMENILLGASAMGIGSCLVSLYRGKSHEILELPKYEIIIGGIMLGHYKRGEEKSHNAHQREPLDKTYTIHG